MTGIQLQYIPVPTEENWIEVIIPGPGGVQKRYWGPFGGPLQPKAQQTPEEKVRPAPDAGQPDPTKISDLFARKPIPVRELPGQTGLPQSSGPSASVVQSPPEPPAPPVSAAPLPKRKRLIFKISLISIYAIIVIMQISCLASSGWTKDSATLATMSKGERIEKATSLIMILTGVLSLLSNVALAALMVWGLLSKGQRMYLLFRKVLLTSVFPWIIGVVIQVAAALFAGWGLGPTGGFAIAVVALLIAATVYADWANNKLIRTAPNQ